jgi:hypothetical protein
VVSVRLIRCPDDSHLTLAFAEEKLQAHVQVSWSLLKNAVLMRNLDAGLNELRRDKAPHQERNRIKNRIKVVSNIQNELRRNRNSNRYLLYAARYHLIDPQGKLTVEERYNMQGDVAAATGNRGRASRAQGTKVYVTVFPTTWGHANSTRTSADPSCARWSPQERGRGTTIKATNQTSFGGDAPQSAIENRHLANSCWWRLGLAHCGAQEYYRQNSTSHRPGGGTVAG